MVDETDFDDVTLDSKRALFQRRYMEFLTSAYNFWIDAETLRRQKVPRAQLSLHQRDIENSLDRCQKALAAAKITQELMGELLPTTQRPLEPEVELTVGNMNDMISVIDMENGKV